MPEQEGFLKRTDGAYRDSQVNSIYASTANLSYKDIIANLVDLKNSNKALHEFDANDPDKLVINSGLISPTETIKETIDMSYEDIVNQMEIKIVDSVKKDLS